MGSYSDGKFEHLATLEDLDEAIQMSEKAVAAAPPTHPMRARMLTNSANYLTYRFQLSGAVDDLHKVIRTAEEAVGATLPNAPDRARGLSILGMCPTGSTGRET